MAEIGAMRDEWMRRTGPFYPLLVAFQLQSFLPVARSLEPSAEDLQRARLWLPVVGALAGAGLALVAALLAGTLAPVVVAGLVVAVGAVATGGRFEVGLARAAERLAGGALAGEPAVVPIALSLAVLLLLRAACLGGIELGAWAGALVASHVAGRFAMLASLEIPELWRGTLAAGDDGPARPRWVPFAIVGAIAVVVVGVVGRGVGITALALAVVVAVAAIQIGRRQTRPDDETASAAAAIAEVVVLLCFAALAPLA